MKNNANFLGWGLELKNGFRKYDPASPKNTYQNFFLGHPVGIYFKSDLVCFVTLIFIKSLELVWAFTRIFLELFIKEMF